MSALVVVVLLAGGAAGPAMLSATVAGQLATAKPVAAVDDVSQERLKRLDVVLQEHVDQNRIAGIVVLVLRDGNHRSRIGFGFETVDRYGALGLSSVGAYRWGGRTGRITSSTPTRGSCWCT